MHWKKIRDREFRAAKEFGKDEVILIGDNEGHEQKEGVTFKLIPLQQWLLTPGE